MSVISPKGECVMYLAEKDRVYTAISDRNGTYIRVMDQQGRVSLCIPFKHKSVSINQRVVTIINERNDVVQMNPDGSGQRTLSTR